LHHAPSIPLNLKPISPDQLRKAEQWLAETPPVIRQRGEGLYQGGAVVEVMDIRRGLGLQSSVFGTQLYSQTLTYNVQYHVWEGTCTCPIGTGCKHCYAAMRTAVDLWRDMAPATLPAGDEDEAPKKSAAKTAPAKASVETFAAEVGEMLGRKLTAAEVAAARVVDSLFTSFRHYQMVSKSKVESITGLVREDRWDWATVELWPSPPTSRWDTWLYIAAYFRRTGLTLPVGLQAITDWAAVDALVGQWERGKKVQQWQNWLTANATKGDETAPVLHQLRARLTERELLLEWKKNSLGEFKTVANTAFRQMQSSTLAGFLALEGDNLRLWRIFNTGYGAEPSIPYAHKDAARMLNVLLRDESLAGSIVGPHDQALPVQPEPLTWQLDVTEAEHTDYHLNLRLPDGSMPPPALVTVDGLPSLYVTAHGIYHGPPLGDLRVDASPITIPAEAVENTAGLALFEKLHVEPPPRLAARVRTVRLRLVFRCRIEPSKLDGNERLVVEMLGESTAGVIAEEYEREGWRPTDDALKPGNDEILRVDRKSLAPGPELLEMLKVSWWAADHEWHKVVGKKFPEQFSAWLTNMPQDAMLLLDPVLASLRDGPIRATVKLEVEESGIDWFDLKVALDVADTTLTKAELKALLDARGGFVRLGAKGWKRLRFDLSPEDEAQLADLGLAARDLDGGKQRLHALQLAGKSATKKMLGEAHALVVERRAEEIRTRVVPPLPEGLIADLRPYQVEGFHFLAYLSTNRFGGILADDMGLGKTLQTLTWLLWLRTAEGVTDPVHQNKPVLVVCPKSVVENWRSETARFAPGLKVAILARGATAQQFTTARAEADLVVMNYAQLRILEGVTTEPWLAVILDEAQAIKNPDSATAHAARVLKCAHRLALSGTPIENRLLDLWSIMQFAMPGILGQRGAFSKTFDQKNDPLARRRLAARVRPFVLRRTKGEVAKDLPERIEEDILCELDGHQGTLYRAELKRARAALLKIETKAELDKARFNILTSLLRLRQICCHPLLVGAKHKKKPTEEQPESAKLAALLDLVEPLIEEGHKVLVFSQFVEMLTLIRAEFVARNWKYYLLTGETEERGKLVEDFQTSEGAAVFLISLRAGGFGLNLTAASYVVLFDPWWNPAVENQAIDRTHRIGQRNTVIAYRLLMKETIEEKIRGLQKQKSALASDILGEEAFARTLTLDDFRFLFAE
jgi:hypothetical protein